jgi:hypothetical protein
MPDPRAKADTLDDGWDEDPQPSTAQKRVRTPEDGAAKKRGNEHRIELDIGQRNEDELKAELDRQQQREGGRAASWAAMLTAVLTLASTTVTGVGLYEILKNPGQDEGMKLVAAGLAALTAAAAGRRSKDDGK